MSTAFHAGGSIGYKGRLSSRPEKNKMIARLLLIEKLCRLDVGALSTGMVIPDADLGRIIKRSTRVIQKIRTTPEYLRMRIQITTGISMDTEQSASQMFAYRKQHFRENLPTAIQAIVSELERPITNLTLQERKFRFEVARDFLDREGSFLRISKTEAHVKMEHDYTSADHAANEIMEAMKGSSVQHDEIPVATQAILEANRSFSNSENLSIDKQEEALAKLEAMPLISELPN